MEEREIPPYDAEDAGKGRQGKAIRESLPHFLALQILRTRSAGAGYLEREREGETQAEAEAEADGEGHTIGNQAGRYSDTGRE